MKKQILALALSIAALNLVAQEAPLPNPAAPFQALKGSQLDPVLKVGAFVRDEKTYLQPSLWIGNKRIGVREKISGPATEWGQSINLLVDNREILRFTFWGAYDESGVGYPFKLKEGTQPELKADEASKSITYSKPYVLPGGKGATFTYTLKALTGSKVELSWDLGISQEKLESLPKDFGVGLWMVSPKNDDFLTFLINKQPLPLADIGKLPKKEREILSGDGLEFVYAPEKPLQGFSLALPDDHSFSLASEAPSPGGKKQAGFIIRASSKARLSHDKLVIDFGEAAEKDAAAPAPVAGIDFWGRDRTCVPAPSTRNIMPNPSFEQGLRYWAWWWGGGRYVPSEIPAYSIVDGGKFGRKCLLIQRSQGGLPMQSFSIPVVKDKTYTLSFYAKAEKPNADIVVGIQCPVQHSQFLWRPALATTHKLNTEWERKSITFTADRPAISVLIAARSIAWLDGFQLEEGIAPTEFVAPEIEGVLRTSDPDNALAVGAPLQAAFEMYGKPGAKGEVGLVVRNYYREKLYDTKVKFSLDKEGVGRIELPWESAKLGTGVFVVQADYHLDSGAVLRDYYRLSIMDFLENKHATKDIFGNLCMASRLTRGDDMARNFMHWGFGSTTYNLDLKEEADLIDKYRITNYLLIVADLADAPEDRVLVKEAQSKWTEVTPEREKQIEDFSYRIAASHPWGKSWAFSTETETRCPMVQKGNFAEWAKIQLSCQRGVKRANPDAIVLPDGGTSGFNALRGIRETEGYLAATQGKVKWDAIATHPYCNLDGVRGGPDLDVETQRLLDLMKKYGYGAETHIDYTEGFNYSDLVLPEWGLTNNDDNNDAYFCGRPSYDTGWREFLHAAWAARTYIICLKYWPQVRSFNIWVSRPYLDQYFAPLYTCKVPNTLGHLLGNPKFKANIQPAAGIRGYVFEDEQGRGVAALWCAIDKVEEGLERGPVVQVQFKGKMPQFIDLMGNPRKVESKKGTVAIQLTSAPLFLRTEKGGADQLVAALNQAEVEGAGLALKVNILPTLSGGIEAGLTNQTNRLLHGDMNVNETKTPFEIPAQGSAVCSIQPSQGNEPGKLYPWKQSISFQFAGGRMDKVDWNMACFYVPHTAAPLPLDSFAKEWEAIPSIPVNNWHVNPPKAGQPPVKAGYPGDLDAKFQLAWDKENLYLRISATDDHFVLTEASKWKDRVLYMHDGCAEVYFDTGANGRSNSVKGYDLDDYRYDFSMGNSEGATGPGKVYRFAEAYHQLAGGIVMPTKDNAAQNVKCQFQRTADGYAYVMIFPQRYIEPLRLEKGTRAGFGLYLHDKDDPKMDCPGKGVGLTTEPGVPPDRRPDLWPILILKD
ncbi:MAG: carbohydrate binding domain-containing protein [Verrucomicrobiae bacterium]